MHLEVVVQAHAAAFLGRRAWDLRLDPPAIADAHLTAWACYRQRTLLPGNDALTLEAEAWGATVAPAPGGDSWAVAAPLIGSLSELAALPEIGTVETDLMEVTLRTAKLLAESSHAQVAVPVCGPLTLADQLAGREALVRDLHDDPFGSREHLLGLVRKLRPWMAALAARGASIIVADTYPCPLDIEPDIFTGLVVPALAWMVNETTSLTGERPVLAVEGDLAAVAYKLFSTNAGTVVCPAATRRARFFQQAREFPGTTVRLDLPRDLWTARDWPTICQEIAAARASARHHPNTILGTGPLPCDASSVLVVDATHFTSSLDEWMDT